MPQSQLFCFGKCRVVEDFDLFIFMTLIRHLNENKKKYDLLLPCLISTSDGKVEIQYCTVLVSTGNVGRKYFHELDLKENAVALKHISTSIVSTSTVYANVVNQFITFYS